MPSKFEAAEQHLKASLQKSFGPDLKGVVVYGHRWDAQSGRDLLRVVVDDATTPQRKVEALPSQIGDLDVEVLRSGLPEL